MNTLRRVIVFDLDGTITKRDTYLPFLVGYLLRNPRRIIRTLHLPFALILFFLGVRDNSWLKRIFLHACLGGLSRKSLAPWVMLFTNSLLNSGLRDGAINTLQKYIDNNDEVVLATASLDIYVNEIAAALGFKHVVNTQVEWDCEDRLTGGFLTNNCYGKEKLKRVVEWMRAHQYETVDIAFSDHHSDLPLLIYAIQSIAVNPNSKLLEITKTKAIKVESW